MLKNYIKIAIRNLRKNPRYSFINIFGLALGMGITILILLYVQHELSYDKYHENSDRIVRASRAWFNQDGEISLHLEHAAPRSCYFRKDMITSNYRSKSRHLSTAILVVRNTLSEGVVNR